MNNKEKLDFEKNQNWEKLKKQFHDQEDHETVRSFLISKKIYPRKTFFSPFVQKQVKGWKKQKNKSEKWEKLKEEYLNNNDITTVSKFLRSKKIYQTDKRKNGKYNIKQFKKTIKNITRDWKKEKIKRQEDNKEEWQELKKEYFKSDFATLPPFLISKKIYPVKYLRLWKHKKTKKKIFSAYVKKMTANWSKERNLLKKGTK